LQPVPRDIAETAESVLRGLFAGPTAREVNAGFSTAIPEGTTLLGVVVDGDLATINMTEGLSSLRGARLLTAVGQIVLTATDVVGIGSVAVEEAGVPLQLPDANGVLHNEPLERADLESLKATGTPAITSPGSAP
jgi:spore germination protein GerM